MARSKSSKRWLREHFSDPFVKQAQKEGYRSRAAYKLLELQKSDRLIQPGSIVVDLGAAPGGWSQVAKELVGKKTILYALDILAMQSIEGVEFIQGDFTTDEILDQLLLKLEGQAVDVVLSDMAPNTSGNSAIDQPRIMLLAELALDFAQKVLKKEGTFVTKIFQGSGSEDFIRLLRQHFVSVNIRKPQASRARSREIYLVAKKYRKP